MIVRAPLKLADAAIREFLTQKADWVRRTQSKLQARAAQRGSHTFETGDTFPLLGQSIPLTLVPAQRPVLRFDGTRFCLSQSAQANARRHFENWYKGQAHAHLQTRLDHFARQHKLPYRAVRISSARTRWGSCSSKNDLSFTWRLVMAPPEVIDYVVVHELAHTVHHNHGPKFWRLVAEIVPEYKQHVRWLKEHGHALNLE